jgi:hypothetical protein
MTRPFFRHIDELPLCSLAFAKSPGVVHSDCGNMGLIQLLAKLQEKHFSNSAPGEWQIIV